MRIVNWNAVNIRESFVVTTVRRRTNVRLSATRSGAAMAEMVLAIPFILLILTLLIFFGRGMVRVQHTQVVDRYEAWRINANVSYHEPGVPHPAIPRPPYADTSTGSAMLNTTFFADHASEILVHGSNNLPGEALGLLIGQTAAFSGDAGAVASNVYYSLPSGLSYNVTVRHPHTLRIWQVFGTDIIHSHTLATQDWRYINGWREAFYRWENLGALGATGMQRINENYLGLTSGGAVVSRVPAETIVTKPEGYALWNRGGPISSPLGGVNSAMYNEMDEGLASLSGSGNGLAGAIRSMYLSEPGYAGPVVVPPQPPAP